MPSTLWSRRDFFSLAGWAGVLAALGAALLGFARFMFPRVLFEPDPVFRAGTPDIYVPGTVDERFKRDQRVWIVRQEDGGPRVHAQLAERREQVQVSCHGSGFKREGTNFEGPAPRPLDRIKIEVGPDGQLVVNKAAVHRMGPGRKPAE